MIAERLSRRWFNYVHSHNLVYNACWEDPRIDRQALALGPDDTLVTITSAGCNVLDYALEEPRQIHAVDLNPRQNALLELKLAGIRRLDFDTFFEMFGRGRLPNHRDAYRDCLRAELSEEARRYWDRRIDFFGGGGWRNSFYFHGTAGTFARTINLYIDRVAKLRDAVIACLEAPTLDAQRQIYDRQLRPSFWSRPLRFMLGRDATLSLLGVPAAQRHQVDRQYPGGIVQFIEDCLDAVFGALPLADNYFWRVYLTGEYSAQCCPEYLKPRNFARLKAGLCDRISIHTTSLVEFLRRGQEQVSRFVLLDHMDWLSGHCPAALEQEWQAIVDRATPAARLIWRSGGLRTEFVNQTQVRVQGRTRSVHELLHYHREWADFLHAQDRVHTYGSFHIADFVAA